MRTSVQLVSLGSVAMLLCGCFHPTYARPACPTNECPDGLFCVAGFCETQLPADAEVDAAATIDAPPDAPPDAAVCFGGAFLTVCLQTPPTAPVTFSSVETLDTASSTRCAAVASATAGGNYCVIAATAIVIDARLRATGARPLVLIAQDSISITVNGAIDVGSHQGATPEIGAGADPSCPSGTVPILGATGGGGGAGGSFAGAGGNGGTGGAPILAAGGVATAATAVTVLRGGCPGQSGAGNGAGVAGHGGGAVFLIAGTRIDIAGTINAAGEGGGGGASALAGGGGGGGGAGGMIGFDAPTIMGNGLIIASGGGGGEGSGTAPGHRGSDPIGIAPALGGIGGSPTGGDGGDGSARLTGAPGSAAGSTGPLPLGAGGGGGGGGAGFIKAPILANLGSNVSPLSTP